jgi:hypothetical protein
MKRYRNLVGDGTCQDPKIVIRWNGHEFGHLTDGPHDLLLLHIRNVLGMWPVIDQMLVQLYGELTDEERLAWYEEHRDDLVEITTGKRLTQNKSVYRWSDKMRFRPVTERLQVEVAPELARVVSQLGGRRTPDSDWH